MKDEAKRTLEELNNAIKRINNLSKTESLGERKAEELLGAYGEAEEALKKYRTILFGRKEKNEAAS